MIKKSGYRKELQQPERWAALTQLELRLKVGLFVPQVECTVTDPSGKATVLSTKTSSTTGSLSFQVAGSVNSVLGRYTLSCTTNPNTGDQVGAPDS